MLKSSKTVALDNLDPAQADRVGAAMLKLQPELAKLPELVDALVSHKFGLGSEYPLGNKVRQLQNYLSRPKIKPDMLSQPWQDLHWPQLIYRCLDL